MVEMTQLNCTGRVGKVMTYRREAAPADNNKGKAPSSRPSDRVTGAVAAGRRAASQRGHGEFRGRDDVLRSPADGRTKSSLVHPQRRGQPQLMSPVVWLNGMLSTIALCKLQ